MTLEYTQEEATALLAQLSAPFALKDLKWRVVSKSKDNKKGMVAAYADPRVYVERLNKLLTPLGWSSEYGTTTVTGISREKKGKTIQSGKITVIGTLEINGVARKASTGECWADDDNGMTRAEAQAFKRACSLFGLGKYLYDLKDFYDHVDTKAHPAFNHWVPLNEYGNPTQLPSLPSWAVPTQPGADSGTQKNTSVAPTPSVSPAKATTAGTATTAPNVTNVTVISPNYEAEFQAAKEKLAGELGRPLFNNILEKVSALMDSGALKGNKYHFALKKLTYASELVSAMKKQGIDTSEINTHDRLMEVADGTGLLKAA